MDSYGFLWVPMGSPWIPMDSYAFPWVPMGTPWIPMDSYVFPWVPMDTHGYPWVPIGSPWIPMDSYGFPWVPKLVLTSKKKTKNNENLPFCSQSLEPSGLFILYFPVGGRGEGGAP